MDISSYSILLNNMVDISSYNILLNNYMNQTVQYQTLSGFINNANIANNILTSFLSTYSRQNTISGDLLTLSNYINIFDVLDISHNYTYYTPTINTNKVISFKNDLSISGNIYCSSLYNYINTQVNNIPSSYNDILTLSSRIYNYPNYYNYLVSLSGQINNISKKFIN